MCNDFPDYAIRPRFETVFLPSLQHVFQPTLVSAVFQLDTMMSPVNLRPTPTSQLLESKCIDMTRGLDGRMDVPSMQIALLDNGDHSHPFAKTHCSVAKDGAIQTMNEHGECLPTLFRVEECYLVVCRALSLFRIRVERLFQRQGEVAD